MYLGYGNQFETLRCVSERRKSKDEEEEKYFETFEPQEQNPGIAAGRENK